MTLNLTVLLLMLQARAYSVVQTATRGITCTWESMQGFEFRLEKEKKKKIRIRDAEKTIASYDIHIII